MKQRLLPRVSYDFVGEFLVKSDNAILQDDFPPMLAAIDAHDQ